MTLKIRILLSLRLLSILAGLTMTWYSEKMKVSTRSIIPVFSCPTCSKKFERFLILVADLVFFAPTFDLWLFFVIFADIVLMLGEKSGKPALLSLWLVIFFINIVGLFLMWMALGLSIYLVILFFSFLLYIIKRIFFWQRMPQ